MNVKLWGFLAVLLSSCHLVRAEPISLITPTGTLSGTLETPKKRLPCPVALILAGSGPTNRDGDSLSLGGENDSLRLLAEGLAAHGIASVRYDKRGVGASAAAGTTEADLRFEIYIDDAVSWGQQLQKNRRFSRLVIIGHSEGALIGMIAARRLNATGFVSIAGAGSPAGKIILDQLKPQLPEASFKEAETIVQNLNAGQTTATIPEGFSALFRPSVQPYLISWFRYDPVVEIAKLRMPVLIAQGTTDLQLSVDDAKLLATAKPDARLLLIDGMNHVLKTVAGDKAAQMPSYIDPAFPVAPKLIAETSRFINALKKP